MLYNIIYTNTNANVIKCHTVIHVYLLYVQILTVCTQWEVWLLKEVVTVKKYVDESHCMRNIYYVFESIINPLVIVILPCIK